MEPQKGKNPNIFSSKDKTFEQDTIEIENKKRKVNLECNRLLKVEPCADTEKNNPSLEGQKIYTEIRSTSRVIENILKVDEYSVYEFYDEEDEKKKIEQIEKQAEQLKLKERTCKTCKAVFEDPLDVLRHKHRAHPVKKIVVLKAELDLYLNESVPENRKKCPICQATISTHGYKSSYVKHLMTHCNEYSFECKVCGMKFRRKDHWQLHERRHIVNQN